MTSAMSTLPILSENGLSTYIAQINKFPMLSHKEEIALANSWIKEENIESAHKMVTSHLRLVVKIAMGFRGYGLPVTDIISEGNIGLMQAVKKFDPEKGFRLSTYAMWWIKASINEYILRSWSLVKMGTTASQKKLFFNLRKAKNRIAGRADIIDRNLFPEEVVKIAKELGVSERDVIEMDDRMYGSDTSLNTKFADEDGSEWVDQLEDQSENQEVIVADSQEIMLRRKIFKKAMSSLSEREQNIIHERKIKEPPMTLEDLSQEYNISRERVRQIEARAIEKLQEAVKI